MYSNVMPGMQMAPWQLCPLLDGPDSFNIVLNGSPPCCPCCGPTPIHADSINQRAPSHLAQTLGVLGSIMNFAGQMDGQQTISFNTWLGYGGATGGCPPHMVGRVNAAVLGEMVAMLSAVEASQQNCCVQCLTCSCAANARNLAAGVAAVEALYGPKLGALSIQQMQYNYEVWVPPSNDGNGNYTPGHWQAASLQYCQVQMPPLAGAMAPMMMSAAPGGVPGMVPGQPGYVAVNPMVPM